MMNHTGWGMMDGWWGGGMWMVGGKVKKSVAFDRECLIFEVCQLNEGNS
jgi:hypothetical protein